jgi:D-inositol-3-phosphate glycosyltransferase
MIDTEPTPSVRADDGALRKIQAPANYRVRVALLTACQDKPYVFGLATSMAEKDVFLEVVGNDEVDCPELHEASNIEFVNLRKDQRSTTSAIRRLWELLAYYCRLLVYAARTKASVLHILWNNRFEHFDRTILMAYYKAIGKRVVLTAHNVNQARRDNKDSWRNRFTLRVQYRLADHIFVHTQKARDELLEDFGVGGADVTVIPFGINNAVPRTNLTSADAKRKLGIPAEDKAILYFGRIRPYKGIEHLLAAYDELKRRGPSYRLIIAGEPKKGSEEYRDEIQNLIRKIDTENRIVCKFQFIPDTEIELYLKAADVLVLPYKEIFQSGVLFLSFSFGLPVVAADVGSFKEEIVEGRNGFLCDPGNATDLASAIERYFASDLYKELSSRRGDIRGLAEAGHSWHVVAEKTLAVYNKLLQGRA